MCVWVPCRVRGCAPATQRTSKRRRSGKGPGTRSGSKLVSTDNLALEEQSCYSQGRWWRKPEALRTLQDLRGTPRSEEASVPSSQTTDRTSVYSSVPTPDTPPRGLACRRLHLAQDGLAAGPAPLGSTKVHLGDRSRITSSETGPRSRWDVGVPGEDIEDDGVVTVRGFETPETGLGGGGSSGTVGELLGDHWGREGRLPPGTRLRRRKGATTRARPVRRRGVDLRGLPPPESGGYDRRGPPDLNKGSLPLKVSTTEVKVSTSD